MKNPYTLEEGVAGSAWMFYNHYNPELLQALQQVIVGEKVEDVVGNMLHDSYKNIYRLPQELKPRIRVPRGKRLKPGPPATPAMKSLYTKTPFGSGPPPKPPGKFAAKLRQLRAKKARKFAFFRKKK